MNFKKMIEYTIKKYIMFILNERQCTTQINRYGLSVSLTRNCVLRNNKIKLQNNVIILFKVK